MATFGPKVTARDRSRFRAAAGKGVTKKFPDGTVVTFDTDPLMLAVADGLMELARRIGEEAAKNAPDSPTYKRPTGGTTPKGKPAVTIEPQPSPDFGLPQNWGVMGWAFGKLIEAEKVLGSTKLTKPRALKLQQDSVQAIVGFGFPARFAELGTEHSKGHPFLGPAGLAIGTSAAVEDVMRRATAGIAS